MSLFFPADWGEEPFIGIVRVLDHGCARAKLADEMADILDGKVTLARARRGRARQSKKIPEAADGIPHTAAYSFGLCAGFGPCVIAHGRWSASGLLQRCRDCSDRPEQDQRVIPRRRETTPLPECCRLLVDGIDHERATANEARGGNTALKGMLDQTCSDPAPGPGDVGGELSEQQAWNWIGWLSAPDGARQQTGHHRCRCQSIIADDAARLMDG